MLPPVVKDMAFLPKGVQALRLTSDHGDLVLPLERGMRISFRVWGSPAPAAPRDPCTMCNGTRCMKGIPDCRTPHVVYMAIFGRIAKVGVTKRQRYALRMREQGAPFGTWIRVCRDGLEARRFERDLISIKGLKGSVRFRDKVNALGAIGSLEEAEGIASGIGLDQELRLDDLRRLYQNPELDSLGKPLILHGDGVKGTVEDTRGDALYLTHRGNLYAYDLRRTIGRRLVTGETKVEAQLTLPNFGALN